MLDCENWPRFGKNVNKLQKTLEKMVKNGLDLAKNWPTFRNIVKNGQNWSEMATICENGLDFEKNVNIGLDLIKL